MRHKTRFLVPSEKSYLWMQIEQILFEWLHVMVMPWFTAEVEGPVVLVLVVEGMKTRHA